MAQALYKLLLHRSPDAELHVLAPTWSKDVLERMPEITHTVELPLGHGALGLRVRRNLGRRLSSEGYAQAIILPRSFKSALVPYFASIPVRTGFRGEWRYGLLNDIRPSDPKVLDQTVKRFVALGIDRDETELPVIDNPSLRIEAESRAQTLYRFGIDTDTDTVALMPGAEFGPAKRWPLKNFSELASRLGRVGVSVWVLGSAKERELGDAILTTVDQPGARNLCGETSLGEVADLLSVARVAVTNDSGLMHMAAAVQTHVVAIYGSSSPRFTPPLTRTKQVLHLNLECGPCFQRRCPLDHFRCMREIAVDTVCSAVVTALGGPH